MKCIELFTGVGGLAMGLHAAGFKHSGLIEFNPDACATLREANDKLKHWPLLPLDTREVDFDDLFGNVHLVAGGPPCQPFSLGGKARGADDPRDMFPEAVRAVRQTQPLAFIFENVKGLLRESFSDYFEYVILQLTYPTVAKRPGERAEEHRNRLERIHTQGRGPSLKYRVVWQLLNAANFGVPQRRERVFMVGFRSDLHVAWNFPDATHSKAALEYSKFSGEYFERHGLKVPARQMQLLRPDEVENSLLPWMTVRDALVGLPDPKKRSIPALNHIYVPGARAYAGHTGSPLDEPAKTLKAGDHGVPGGENMIAFADGRVRYFTLREAARMQTFPDDYLFKRSWTESMRGLGNAVPVRLAEAVARSVEGVIRPIAARMTAHN